MNLGRHRPTPARTSSPVRQDTAKNALTAAGAVVNRRNTEMLRRLVQPWQYRSFAYYDILGEIKEAAQFYSRALSQLDLYAGEWKESEDGQKEIVPTTDPTAQELLDRIQDPGGGRSGLLSSYGRLMFLTGEAFLFVTREEDSGEESWEMLSMSEVRPIGGTYQRIKAPSLMAEEYRVPEDGDYAPLDGKTAVAYRLWKRHPQYSELADATMQGVLDICEELVLLTQGVRARTRNRMMGPGILFLDEALSPAPLEVVGDEDPEEDPFLADIIEAATTAITDEGSAAAVAPIIQRIPVPEGKTLRDVVYHLQLSDPTQLYPETGLRREAIERIAIGLDLPPEILTGMADANHWSAWIVDEQTWKGHIQPVAQQLVDDLTAAYFRPALREAGVADWQKYVIDYDAAGVINHPDRTKDAKDLHDRGAIGDAALRDAADFAEGDAQTAEERQVWLSIKSRDPGFAVTGVPSRSTTSGAEAEAPAISDGGTVDAGLSSAEVDKGPPDQPADAVEPTDTALTGSNGRPDRVADQVMGAAALAVHRCREVAGNRLKSLAKRDTDALKLTDGVPAGLVASTLGRETVRALGGHDGDLIAGTRELLVASLEHFGVDRPAALTIADGIEQHAVASLYQEKPRPFPPSFVNYVAGALSDKAAV